MREFERKYNENEFFQIYKKTLNKSSLGKTTQDYSKKLILLQINKISEIIIKDLPKETKNELNLEFNFSFYNNIKKKFSFKNFKSLKTSIKKTGNNLELKTPKNFIIISKNSDINIIVEISVKELNFKGNLLKSNKIGWFSISIMKEVINFDEHFIINNPICLLSNNLLTKNFRKNHKTIINYNLLNLEIQKKKNFPLLTETPNFFIYEIGQDLNFLKNKNKISKNKILFENKEIINFEINNLEIEYKKSFEQELIQNLRKGVNNSLTNLSIKKRFLKIYSLSEINLKKEIQIELKINEEKNILYNDDISDKLEIIENEKKKYIMIYLIFELDYGIEKEKNNFEIVLAHKNFLFSEFKKKSRKRISLTSPENKYSKLFNYFEMKKTIFCLSFSLLKNDNNFTRNILRFKNKDEQMEIIMDDVNKIDKEIDNLVEEDIKEDYEKLKIKEDKENNKRTLSVLEEEDKENKVDLEINEKNKKNENNKKKKKKENLNWIVMKLLIM